MNLSEAFTQIGQWFASLAQQVLPAGGDPDQVLAKVDGTDYNVEWRDPAGGGGVEVAADNAFYYDSGVPTVGPHTATVTKMAFPSAYMADFVSLSPDGVTISAPVPVEQSDSLYHIATINGASFGNFHIVWDAAATTSEIAVDCDFTTGIKQGVVKKIVNNHAGSVEVSFLSAINVSAMNLTTDGLGNPMVKMNPAQGSVINVLYDGTTFTVFVWGDTVP